MLASEPTYEGLLRLLAEGWPSGGLFSNEGGAFLGGYALSKDHRLRTLAGLSELWDGRPVDRVRSGDGLRLLYGRRLSLHLMAQPVVARTLLNDPLAQGQGLLARMLTAAPESTAGARRYVEDDIFATPAYQAYAARLGGLLERVAQGALANGRVLEGLSLRPVRLDPPAKGLWVSFYDHIEANLRGELSQIRAFASKLPEHALRLAGTLAVLKNPDLGVLTREDVKQGIAIAQFYGAEALRLAGGYRIPRELAVAAEVWAWLTRHCQAQGRRVFHLAEVYRLGPPAVRSAKAAREVLRVLEGHYYLAHRPNVEIDGASRRDAWEVNPHALSQV
ncbi:MAG: DUF3987 domain-containing protein [Meiothermus sp.]|uniref:DUF3987 domain-containing protein n=1 Tax=Meiothermus sp. TaxID=1955249 RepID=UPI00298F2C86|nr:DUF3987 domain-containing protein [Meiothermus sp.]MDW8480902.1 DUF3987 domain-containing protein [Meiothermus sp.]